MHFDKLDRGDARDKSLHHRDPAAASVAGPAQHLRPCIDTASRLSKYRHIFTPAFATPVTCLSEQFFSLLYRLHAFVHLGYIKLKYYPCRRAIISAHLQMFSQMHFACHNIFRIFTTDIPHSTLSILFYRLNSNLKLYIVFNRGETR